MFLDISCTSNGLIFHVIQAPQIGWRKLIAAYLLRLEKLNAFVDLLWFPF